MNFLIVPMSWSIRSVLAFLAVLSVFNPGQISARDMERFALEIEGGPFWQARNDIRLPNETGTEFSLVDGIGAGPYGAFRVEAAFDLN